jgi:hypothetical protein
MGVITTYRNTSPCADESREDLTTTNVDILGAERNKIVCCTDGVGRNVDTKGDDNQADRSKRSSSSTAMAAAHSPIINNLDRVPDYMAIRCFGGCSGEDTKQTNNGEDARNDNCLDVRIIPLGRIPGKVGNVEAQSGVVAEYRVEIGEKRPGKNGAVHLSTLGYNNTMAESIQKRRGK